MNASENTPLLALSVGQFLQNASRSVWLSIKSESGRYRALLRTWRRLEEGEQKEDVEDVLRDIQKDEHLNGQMLVFSILAILFHLTSGIFVLHWIEGWTLYDSAYFCVVTTTTVGYGDITPKKGAAKLFVVYYSLVSIAIVSLLLSYVVGTLVDRQEESLLHALGEDESDNWVESPSLLGAMEKDELILSFVWVLVIIVVGVAVFMRLEDLTLLDAVYVTIISTSTVGFGDFEPRRKATKLIMTVWLCFSTVCMAKLVGDIAHAFAKMKQRAATRRLLGATLDTRSLLYIDRDQDRRVSKAEFLVEMLTRTGRVEDQEMNKLLAMFDELDANKDGYISAEECQPDL
ncbi:unnamed protein product [Agarophyton chilense]|eukprot:gb/GEZJ01007198.1/.p1 GENE.gb/GEZJ01007198.1/~~gb/GEZJ01007198.1/.p1  ORF type:complete len:346 (+),score=47.45 gb/GEZJ01007198.1/:453-1490(+)